MHIKCWGTRGSIPVSGKEYLKYGGDTSCIQIKAQSGETVIFDAGTGLRKMGADNNWDPTAPCYLFLTHAHWDHVAGFTFFKPLLDKRQTLIIQNHNFSGLSVKKILENFMSPPLFPISMVDFKANILFTTSLSSSFSIGSLDIKTIPLSHPNGGYGYQVKENGRTFVFLTDNELGFDHPDSQGFDAYVRFAKNADLLLHDAEFTPQEYLKRITWGHSDYSTVLDLASQAGVKRLGLFHINQDRNDKDMDRIEKQCLDRLKQKGMTMDCFAVAAGMAFTL